jgi:nucleoside-diphosphate-sugar epimerase
MNVLVTGANGFIGSHLTQLLVEKGHTVRALLLPGTVLGAIDGLQIDVVYADITQPETFQQAFQGIEVVYHLAAMPSVAWGIKVFEVNFFGTKNVLDEAVRCGVKRMVFMSSLVVHGFKHFSDADENTPKLTIGTFIRPYATSKVMGEILMEEYQSKIETVIIRPGFNIYGPNDKMTSKEMLDRLSKGQLMGYVDGGKSKLGFVYAENLVFGLLCAGTHPSAVNNTFIIADYEPNYIHLPQLLHAFSKELAIKPKINNISSYLLYPVAFIIDCFYFLFLRNKMPLISTYIVNTSTHDLHFSSRKAQDMIGYKQKVSFEEGVRRTVEWYKNL